MAVEPSATPSPGDVIPAWYRPISVAEYHQMIDAGVFDEDDRLELVDGVIVRMSPQSLAHAHAIAYLNELLVRAVSAHFQVRCQLPMTMVRSEPEPDFAVVARRAASRAPRHPPSAVLVIEVSVESFDKDVAKAAIYAEAGVQEYWIVDAAHRRVEVRRKPQRTKRSYAEHVVVTRGELTALCLPGVTVPIAPLFRARRAR